MKIFTPPSSIEEILTGDGLRLIECWMWMQEKKNQKWVLDQIEKFESSAENKIRVDAELSKRLAEATADRESAVTELAIAKQEKAHLVATAKGGIVSSQQANAKESTRLQDWSLELRRRENSITRNERTVLSRTNDANKKMADAERLMADAIKVKEEADARFARIAEAAA